MNSANKTDTKCLGFLRFLAACMIAFFWHYQHFGNNFQYPFSSVFHWSYNYGYLMVELFFALSGFGMFLGYADRIAAHQISFKDYILFIYRTNCIKYRFHSLALGQTKDNLIYQAYSNIDLAYVLHYLFSFLL